MKRRNLKNLKLNKKAIAKFGVFGGRAPQSHTCGNNPETPDGPGHQWFTDAYIHTCQTFPGTGCL